MPTTANWTGGHDWQAYVERGRRWRRASDDANWGLGDDVVEMCDRLGFDPKPGRPPANSDVRTLSDYAAEVDISSKRVSECYANSKFYGKARTSGDFATWAHHDRARRASDGSLDNALELLATAHLLKLHYRAFVRYLDGILFEGVLTREVLLTTWDTYTKPGQRVFVSFTEVDE